MPGTPSLSRVDDSANKATDAPEIPAGLQTRPRSRGLQGSKGKTRLLESFSLNQDCVCCSVDDEAPREEASSSNVFSRTASTPTLGLLQSDEELPKEDLQRLCNRNIRRAGLQTLEKIRQQREFAIAKAQRQKAQKEVALYNARRSVLRNASDERIRKSALTSSAPALPDLPERPVRMSTRLELLPLPSRCPSTFADTAPKIDFHQHCTPGDEKGLQELLEAGHDWGIESGVLLSLRLPRSSRQDVRARNDWVLEMGAKYPSVLPFVTVIEDDDQAPRMFAECLERGARGLKLIGWHSNYIKTFDYDLRHAAMMQVFQIAAEKGAPVLIHLWVGYGETRRDYIEDLEKILSELPGLRLVLAHFGLGFDAENLPRLDALASRHRNLYFDTSLYGSFCELWFSRASNHASALREFIIKHPRQILFGTDVFASKLKRPSEYVNAMRASIGFIERPSVACAEFRRTSYFDKAVSDKYGPIVFDPLHLHGLGLGEVEGLLPRIFLQNAKDILDIGA